jgi:hypothetical protein
VFGNALKIALTLFYHEIALTWSGNRLMQVRNSKHEGLKGPTLRHLVISLPFI